jgi:hypothetical protein
MGDDNYKDELGLVVYIPDLTFELYMDIKIKNLVGMGT